MITYRQSDTCVSLNIIPKQLSKCRISSNWKN